MPTYLAFLRAVNLGPRRQFPSADIRRVVASAGFAGAATHINSGNARFESSMRSRSRIEKELETAFAADRGFDVPTIVFRSDEFADLARRTRALSDAAPGLARHYVYLLKNELPAETADAVRATATDAGEMVVDGRAVHALLFSEHHAGDVDPLRAAKLLGVATSRNATVISALAAKWC